MRVLRKGMGGPDVKQWQEFLAQQGFDIGTADGRFGARTSQATVEFQQRNGLGNDGVVGPGTLAKASELGFVEARDPGVGDSAAASSSSGSPGSLSEQAVAQIMPNLKAAKRAAFFPFLTRAMDEFEINSPARQAAFLAQLAHESAEFRFMEEIWGPTSAQRRYEGRRDLGNTVAGDGFRFKGRGPIQITGRSNYKRYGDLLGIDLVGNPQQAATPEVGFRIAGLYWRQNNCNTLADQQKFVSITRVINGGTNGLEDRTKYYERAKRVLGVSAGTRGFESLGPRDTGDAADRVFNRGLDETGEPTPTAAERNASESSAAAGKSGGKAGAAKKAAKGGVKASAKKAAKSAAKKAAVKSAAKKSGAKKSAAKKSTVKKAAVKKAAGKKAAAGKAAAKKSAPPRGVRPGGASKRTAKKGAASKASRPASKKGAAPKKGARPGASRKSSGKSASKKGTPTVPGRRGRRGSR